MLQTAGFLNQLVALLGARERLGDDDRSAILSLRSKIEIHSSGRELAGYNDSYDHLMLLIEGFASQTQRVGGKKQVFKFHMRGGAIGLQDLIDHDCPSSVQSHGPTTIALISKAELVDLFQRHPSIMRAVLREAQIQAAISREWLFRLGGRSARARISHLLLEFEARFQAQAQCKGHFVLPISQGLLASALGLSLVHFNKSLKWLQDEGYLMFHGRKYEVLRHTDLSAFCDFDPAYLCLQRPQGVVTERRAIPIQMTSKFQRSH